MARGPMRGARGGPSSSAPPDAENGVFEDGKWWCNCQPRQPAVERLSKTRKNPNRPFYGCQVVRKGCNFFQWCDDAAERVVLRSRSEQSIGKFFRQGPNEETGSDPSSSQTLAHPPDPANDLLGDMSSGDERSLVRMADEIPVRRENSPDAAVKRETSPSTPPGMSTPRASADTPTRNNKRKSGHRYLEASEDESDEERPPSTPSRPRTQVLGGLATPVTAQKEPPSKRQRTGPSVPTSAVLESSQPNHDSEGASRIVISLLRTQRNDPDVFETVKDFLGKHDAKVKGIRASRDLLRQERKRLLEQIADLQKQLKASQNIVGSLKEVLGKCP